MNIKILSFLPYLVFVFTLIGCTPSTSSSKTSDPSDQTSTPVQPVVPDNSVSERGSTPVQPVVTNPLTPDQQNLLAQRKQCMDANITKENLGGWLDYCLKVNNSLKQANLPVILTPEQIASLQRQSESISEFLQGSAIRNSYDMADSKIRSSCQNDPIPSLCIYNAEKNLSR